ncbi:hypothetical protein [Paenibacillus sp. CFBP 13594]|uniref:hypothetical protein n=1 Tax=Paenibacillus sp. CFBP 13594 TaxID=2774037 RepID=UPI001A7EC2A4|nr:hypothetical protein [Paenibacillus sp. CFBP 13594]
MLDGITIFMFAFGCFKISFKDYWKEILVTNLVISVGTFLLRDEEFLVNLMPFLCFLLLVASLTFYFRIRIWGSLKLSLYGFVAQIIAQFTVVALFMFVSKLTFSGAADQFGTYVQLIGDGALILLTLVLQKRRVWFTTMSHDYNFKIKLTKINILSMVIAVVIIAFLYNIKSVDNILLAITFWAICLINLMYVDIRKEKSGSYD